MIRDFWEYVSKLSNRLFYLSGLKAISNLAIIKPIKIWSREIVLTVLLLIIFMFGESDFEKQKKIAGLNTKNPTPLLNLAKIAAERGDLVLAKNVYSNILGSQDFLEEAKIKIFPREYLRFQIKAYENLLDSFPEHRDLYLRLAILNWGLNNKEVADKYLYLAKKLDPNGEEVVMVEKVIED